MVTTMEVLSDEESQAGVDVTHIFTEKEILRIGLLTVHFSRKRIKRTGRSRNIARFKAHFGATPPVVAAVFEDLQRTNLLEAKLPPD